MAQYKVKSAKYSFALHGGATGFHNLGAFVPAGAICRNLVIHKVTALAGGFKAAVYLSVAGASTGICLQTGITYNGATVWATALTAIAINGDKSYNNAARQLTIRTNGTHTAGAYNVMVEYIK